MAVSYRVAATSLYPRFPVVVRYRRATAVFIGRPPRKHDGIGTDRCYCHRDVSTIYNQCIQDDKRLNETSSLDSSCTVVVVETVHTGRLVWYQWYRWINSDKRRFSFCVIRDISGAEVARPRSRLNSWYMPPTRCLLQNLSRVTHRFYEIAWRNRFLIPF